LAPIAISTSSCAARDSEPGSPCTSTMETAAAVPSLSFSQFSRKVPIAGRKNSTSTISTNTMVSSSSLVESPRASGTRRAGAALCGVLSLAGAGSLMRAVPLLKSRQDYVIGADLPISAGRAGPARQPWARLTSKGLLPISPLTLGPSVPARFRPCRRQPGTAPVTM